MLKKLGTFVLRGALLGAFLVTVFVAGFLQEFASDELPKRLASVGSGLGADTLWIEIRLQPMTLAVMDGDTLVKRYEIGFGRGRIGGQAGREGSTPLGEYRIVRKLKRDDPFERGSRFLQLDYPSEEDVNRGYDRGAIDDETFRRFRAAAAEGALPPTDTPLGGPLGIQGNYWFFRDRRFTDGSVALANADVNELFEHVAVGTRVVIRPD